MEIKLVRRKFNGNDYIEMYHNDEELSSVIINNYWSSVIIFKKILRLKKNEYEKIIIIDSDNFKLDNNKEEYKINYGIDNMKNNLIINANIHSSKTINENEFNKEILINSSFPYKINNLEKTFKLKYTKHTKSSTRDSWLNTFEEINNELSNLKMRKMKVNSINEFKRLEKLIYNEKIRKIISRTKRKEKLTKLMKD